MENNERKILLKAVEGMRQRLSIEIKSENVVLGRNKEFDALLSLRVDKKDRIPLVAEVKKTADSVESVIAFLRKVPRGMIPLLVAERISPEVAAYLDKRKILFYGLDGQIRLLVPTEMGKGPSLETDSVSSGEAMIRVLFVLLQAPVALEWPQRKLASVAGVSLGTVSQTLKNMRASHYLIDLKDAVIFHPDKLETLLRNWSTLYVEKMKPKLFVGTYRALEGKSEPPAGLKGKANMLLGGEWAAERIFSHRVRGEGTTRNLYYRGEIADLIRASRIVRDESANSPIYVIKAFWPSEFDGHLSCAPDIVTFADLDHQPSARMRDIADLMLRNIILPRINGPRNV
jgi:hypothetical protein